MIVLEVNRIFQNLIGLAWIRGGKFHEHSRIFAQILAFGSMLWLTLWLFLNFIFNVNDNIQMAFSSLPVAFGFVFLSSLNGRFLINRAHFHSLFEDIQRIVNDSTYDSCRLSSLIIVDYDPNLLFAIRNYIGRKRNSLHANSAKSPISHKILHSCFSECAF